MRTPRVLIVTSAADALRLENGREYPTGCFLGELSDPLAALLDAGYEVAFASPGGRRLSLDPSSLRRIYWLGRGEERDAALSLVASLPGLQEPQPLEALTPDQLRGYAGLFIPGGHAPMVDLAEDPSMARVLRFFHEQGRPIGMICHGPAAMLSLRRGDWPFVGYRMTAFTHVEERVAEKLFLHGRVPYYLDDALAALGARIERSVLPMRPKVVRDRELITGQNPASARLFARVFLQALRHEGREPRAAMSVAPRSNVLPFRGRMGLART